MIAGVPFSFVPPSSQDPVTGLDLSGSQRGPEIEVQVLQMAKLLAALSLVIPTSAVARMFKGSAQGD